MVNVNQSGNQLSLEQSDFVRLVAIMLITNSHMDSLYPLPQLATGGALGNSLFFLLSGYGLSRSYMEREMTVGIWFLRRIMRIYPSVLIVTLLMDIFLNHAWSRYSAIDYISSFIWPTNFWFVGALTLFYIIFFPALRLKRPAAFLGPALLTVVPYIFVYISSMDLSRYNIEGPGYFKWLFYFAVMFIGGYLGTRRKGIPKPGSNHLLLFIVLLILYFSLGFLFLHSRFSEFQALLHILTIPIIYLALILSRASVISEKILKSRYILPVITVTSGATLEIYLLQYYVYSNRFIQSLGFPVNVFAFAVILLGISIGLAFLSRRIRSIILHE